MEQDTAGIVEEKSRMRIIWFFIKPYKVQILVLFVLFLLVGSLEAATIAAIYPILNAAFSPGSSESNFILTLFRTLADWLPVSDLFVSYCVVFVIFAVLAFIIKITAIFYRTRFIAHLVARTQTGIFSRFIRADYQYFLEHRQGELLYNAVSAPYQLLNLVYSVTELVSQALLSISVFLLLFSLSWQGALVVMVLGLVYIFISRNLGKSISYNAMQKELEAHTESNVILNEGVSGIRLLKVFSLGDDWITKFDKTVNKRWENQTRRNIWQQIPPIVLLLVLYLGVALVALIIKVITPSGYMELIPVFGAFAFSVFRLLPFVSSIGSTTMLLQASLPDCELMYRVLNEKIIQIEDGDREIDSFRSEIRLDRVTFAYKDRAETLKDFSVVFKKGETTAIVGRSGSGKTTVLNLIFRLFDVQQGKVSIDGHDIKEYRLDSWLKHVGYVSQDTFIINDTVENNITFGSDQYSSESVIKAAVGAGAHGFISELPDGYDTIVGDRGTKLSGGQAQRIAIARALIRNPEILIFDEATNNLDNLSEAEVQKSIEAISRDHTVILIAHRLSTIVYAGKIVVIDKGRLVEQGTHTELMEKKGAYWRLYQRQGD